ncbi:hypothetical protein Pcinc_018728 [Petrolisthes cinctipes]|uniref:Uncharacterized protein n=1 Tax=Petrolisthes cinctipes TaxID=88211 RepID=A0AAE1FRG1_PETCI|nr:hypothetical protein Pcinc_018728 [Petrolisthes cinctipes]
MPLVDEGGVCEVVPPTPPPRALHSSSRASVTTPSTSSSSLLGPEDHLPLGAEGGLDVPTPPPRSRRSVSRASDTSSLLGPDDFLPLGPEGGLDVPTPPPRSRRSGSRASDTSSLLALPVPQYPEPDPSMTSYSPGPEDLLPLGAEGGLDVPTPPPRSRRSGSRASDTSSLLALPSPPAPIGLEDLPPHAHAAPAGAEGGLEVPPTPPLRTRRSGSSASLTSESSLGWSPTPTRRRKRPKTEAAGGSDAMEIEGGESPVPPPRSRRPGSRTSQASTVTSETQWDAETPRATPPPTSDVAEIPSFQAAPPPFSTPSPPTAVGEYE